MPTIFILGAIVALGLGIALEVSLRLIFGLGNPLIYRSDPEIGYLLAPNQKVRRFNKRIQINQYSMRSGEVDPRRPPNSTRILLLGDSIANGSWWTDQTETISTLMEQGLKSARPQPIEVLNASANSWGPRNQLAYLQKYGSFEAQIIILLMNTDDLFSGPPHPQRVGRDPNYPDRRPLLALTELWQRYLKKEPALAPPPSNKGDVVGINLAALGEIHSYSQEHQAQLLIALTPLLRETIEPPRAYEQKARQRLEEFALSRQIPYLDLLDAFKSYNPAAALYRDNIHLTPAGNQIVTQTLSAAAQKFFSFP